MRSTARRSGAQRTSCCMASAKGADVRAVGEVGPETGPDGTGTAGREALDAVQHAVDVLTDALLSHLAYEERELIGPLARHGFS